MNTKKKRLVAVILYKNEKVVQSKFFSQHKVVGDPYVIIDRFNSWNADEIIYLNIRHQNNNNNFEEILSKVGKRTFMPLTIGGGIKTFLDAKKYFELGADKISINSSIYYNPKEIEKCAKVYGSQSIVASIDVKLGNDNLYDVFINNGRDKINIILKNYLKKIENIGFGEILLNAIHKDGSMNGYDLDLVTFVKKHTKLPLIILGGVGSWSDFIHPIKKIDIDAVAASNIFHHSENSYYEAIKYLNNNGCNMRPSMLSKLTKNII